MWSKVWMGIVMIQILNPIKGEEQQHEDPTAFSLLPNADSVNRSLEELRQKLIDGDPEAGIPSFKPFRLDRLPIEIDEKMIKAKLNLNNLVIEGITDFVLTAFDLRLLKLHVAVGVPKITARSEFNGTLKLFDLIRVDNGGSLEVEIVNFAFDDAAKIGIIPPRTYDTLVTLQFANFRAGFKITINGEDIGAEASELINYVVPKLFDEHQDVISGRVSPIVEKIVNDNIKLILN